MLLTPAESSGTHPLLGELRTRCTTRVDQPSTGGAPSWVTVLETPDTGPAETWGTNVYVPLCRYTTGFSDMSSIKD